MSVTHSAVQRRGLGLAVLAAGITIVAGCGSSSSLVTELAKQGLIPRAKA